MLEFFETAIFTRQVTELLKDSEYAALQGVLVVDPEAGDLIPGTGGLEGVSMKKALFDELAESIRESGRIRRGEQAPSRGFVFNPEDVRAIRQKLDKSQSEFARMIGVTISTLQNWEQGRRQPQGPARALLVVAGQEPQLVANALAAATRREVRTSPAKAKRVRNIRPDGRALHR